MQRAIIAKLWLLIGSTWTVGAGAASFLMYHSRQISRNYDKILDREIHLQDSARQMQVKFKIQVQEWKDVLLRGHDADSLKKYPQAFQENENAVRKMAETLSAEAPDPKIRALTDEFARAHVEMGNRYASALHAFVEAKGRNACDADKMVKGQDRAPTALVDKIVDLLRDRVDIQRSSERQALVEQHWVMSTILLLAFGGIAVGSVLTIRTLSSARRQTALELTQAAELVASAAGVVASSSQSLGARFFRTGCGGRGDLCLQRGNHGCRSIEQ